jgi:hypothetical protein
MMSTEAEAILEQIQALPITNQHEVMRKLARCIGAALPASGELYGEPLTDEDIEDSARVAFKMLDEEERRAESR